MAKSDAKGAAAAAPVATEPDETTAPEAPEQEEGGGAGGGTVTPEETPAETAVDNATIAEQILNAPEGSVTTTFAGIPKEVASLVGRRRQVGLRLGALLGILRDFKQDTLALIHEESKTMPISMRDRFYTYVRNADRVEQMAQEGTQILTGKVIIPENLD